MLDFDGFPLEPDLDPATENMFMEAIAAARAGDRLRARTLLTRLLRADSSVVDYWIWMSASVDSKREKIYCLESALRLDPTNRAAMRGLAILGARAPQEAELAAAPRISRRQMPSVASGPGLGRFLQVPLQIPWGPVLIGSVLVVALFVTGGLAYSFFTRTGTLSQAPTLPPASVTPTETPAQPSATPTAIPASIRALRTPIPTELAGTPIIFFVPQTPTPTPVLGVTPHGQYEAYGAGIAAINRGDYADAAAFFRQVIDLDSSLADAHYFLAESLRLLAVSNPQAEDAGRALGEAFGEYDRAILLNADFAPAYLGRGMATLLRTQRNTKPEDIRAEDLPADYARAIKIDPLLSQAYVAQADFYAMVRLWKTMEETLQAALDAGVRDPIVYIRLSEAQINRERYDQALENAIEGSAADPTNLDGYFVLGRALVRLELFAEALAPLQTYVAYRGDDHRGWSDLGTAQYHMGDLPTAWESLNQALALNDRYAPAYLGRGWLNLELGDYESAFRDFNDARRFGSDSFQLLLGFGYAHYRLKHYQDALENAHKAIDFVSQVERRDLRERDVSRGYALRALISEDLPDLQDYAVQNWQWILGLEYPDPAVRTMAEEHLALLTGEVPTRAPSLTPTATRTPTPTATGILTPTITPSPSPTASPPPVTPTPTRTPTRTATPTSGTPVATSTPWPTLPQPD